MGKVLGWILFGIAAWVAWKFWVVSQRRQSGAAARKAGDGQASPPGANGRPRSDTQDADASGVERIVRCAHCDLHLPASEARFASGRAYCSDEHLRLDRSRQDAS